MTNGLKIRLTTMITALTILLLTAPRAQAQLEDSGEFIRAGLEDANTLFDSYMKPFGQGFGAGLNSGWVNSAKPHGKFGFSLSFRVSGALVPEVDQSFDVTSLLLQRVEYVNEPGNSPISPTISGINEDGPRMVAEREVDVLGQTETVTLADFNMPPGTGIAVVPAPMIQAGLGLFRDTEIQVRYLPPVNMPFDGNIDLIGGSIKHGLNQWLPGGTVLPVDLSLMVGYTSLDLEVGLDVQPESDPFTRNPYQGQPETWDNQNLNFSSNGFTTMLLVGKNLPVVAFYGGLGYETSTTSIRTAGSYPITADDDPQNPDFNPAQPLVVQKVEDPIDLSFDGKNTMKAMAGLRFRLGFFSINADYTLANYSIASLGVGFSFR